MKKNKILSISISCPECSANIMLEQAEDKCIYLGVCGVCGEYLSYSDVEILDKTNESRNNTRSNLELVKH